MSFSAVELANGASDGMVNHERLERISQLAEMEDLQASRDLPLAPLFIKVCFLEIIRGTALVLVGHSCSRFVSWTRILENTLILSKLMQ